MKRARDGYHAPGRKSVPPFNDETRLPLKHDDGDYVRQDESILVDIEPP